jgi:DNA repair exonuclease SbcCD ATPase subunit
VSENLKAVKIDDEAYKLLEEVASKQQVAIKDIVTKAVFLYLKGIEVEPAGKEIREIKDKFIELRYLGKCKRCGRELNPGDHAYYVRIIYEDGTPKTLLYCLNCYYETIITDKTLARLYVKKKELETVVKGLKKRADELAESILTEEKLSELFNYFVRAKQTINNLIAKYSNITSEEAQRTADELTNIYDEIDKLIQALSTVKTVRAKKKPPIPKYTYR